MQDEVKGGGSKKRSGVRNKGDVRYSEGTVNGMWIYRGKENGGKSVGK